MRQQFTTSAPTWPAAVVSDPRGFTPWKHEPDEFDRDADEDCEEFDDFDCGLIEGGLCMNAGSEWCDFECPMRDTLLAGADSPDLPL